jgi:hypothetical protein
MLTPTTISRAVDSGGMSRRSDYELEVDRERDRVYLTQYGQLDDEEYHVATAESVEQAEEFLNRFEGELDT